MCIVVLFFCSPLVIILFLCSVGSREIAIVRAEYLQRVNYYNVLHSALVDVIKCSFINYITLTVTNFVKRNTHCFYFSVSMGQHHLCQRMHDGFRGVASTQSLHCGRSLHCHIIATGMGCTGEKKNTAWKIYFTARCHSQHFYFHRATKSKKKIKTTFQMVKVFQITIIMI